eukprot:CAMPEP_0178970882 /NCGR_PEP_ID=MMETSP0789-20121207/19878_1 /TAXON_ID=3005 /ORGANISM="Rhizosolenia setigera, Strain CCMP 1694" /LENGTH=476 /DNA_ID=CAMNT_0020657615 /DNA_START=61 /DNA_END=1491 /DNA_ORIENTATION=-
MTLIRHSLKLAKSHTRLTSPSPFTSPSLVHQHGKIINPNNTSLTLTRRGASIPANPSSASTAATAVKNSAFTFDLPAQLTKASNPHLNVARWILGCTGFVAGIVHVGGVTRLTKSGLSMTDWKPLGSLPPITHDEWLEEFERYKQFPEYSQRQNMDLDEFKFIYFWEWGHRMLGRTIGVMFAVPFGYYMFKRKIPTGFPKRLTGLFALGGAQGLVGWWMVKSGLGENRREDRKEIRVSPYRLAAHLTVAVTTFSLLFRTGLDLLHLPHQGQSILQIAKDSKLSQTIQEIIKIQKTNPQLVQRMKTIRVGALGITGLTGITLVSGAFVAGNDAGRAYNTFPKMTYEEWVPWDDMVDKELTPAYRNMFENTATVQFNHRVLGVTTALSGISLATFGLTSSNMRSIMTPQVKRGLKLVGGVAGAQASLGIMTLLYYVPISLAAVHQLGSLALVSSGVYLVHSCRYVAPRILRNAAKNVV